VEVPPSWISLWQGMMGKETRFEMAAGSHLSFSYNLLLTLLLSNASSLLRVK
jgi:hypothetical protein